MPDENWRDVVGFEEFYEVSNLGVVRSKPRILRNKNGFAVRKGKVRSQSTRADGYLMVSLCVAWKHKTVLVHRLVAEAFLEPKFGCNQVNHIDLNKRNNCVENLEWVTGQQNIDHAVHAGRFRSDSNPNRRHKLAPAQRAEVVALRRAGHTYASIAKRYSVRAQSIFYICKQAVATEPRR